MLRKTTFSRGKALSREPKPEIENKTQALLRQDWKRRARPPLNARRPCSPPKTRLPKLATSAALALPLATAPGR